VTVESRALSPDALLELIPFAGQLGLELRQAEPDLVHDGMLAAKVTQTQTYLYARD
jgi:hypothetical protein